MKLHHLRNFIAAAEHSSFRAAARELHLAQPAITRSIRELEQELGVPLFERRQQGVRLTAGGQSFLRRAQAVQLELRRGQEELRQINGEMVGEVSIAMSTVANFLLQGKIVRNFRAKYPRAMLTITEGFFWAVESQIFMPPREKRGWPSFATRNG
jgi:LysR family transcriptional regulator of abg operon